MKTELINDETTAPEIVTAETSNKVEDIEELLKGYKNTPVQTTEESNIENKPVFDSQPNNIHADLSDPKKYYQTGAKKGQPRPNKKSVNVEYIEDGQPGTLSGEILTGALFLTLIDLILPLLIALINNKISDSKIEAKQLMLTDKQKKELAPLAEQVIKKINIQANPIALLSISLLGIYGINFAALKMNTNEN